MSDFPSVLPDSTVPDPRTAPAIRWGVLGPGGIARAFADAVHHNTASRVMAVGSRSAERAAAFAADFEVPRHYASYEALVADDGIDAVYVASPHSEHAAHAALALRAGKPVLVEKAFTQNAAQARGLADLARESGLALMEAMWARFLPQAGVLRRLLADGALGTVHTVIADHGQAFDIGPEHRLLNPQLAGGALLDLGIYPVSFASFVLGAPDAVTAVGELTGTGVDGQVSMVLRTGSAHALLSTTQLARTPTTATVSGDRARVEFDGSFYAPTGYRLVHRDGRVLTGDPGPIRGSHGLAYEAAHFAAMLADGLAESPLLPLAETVAIMSTLDEVRGRLGVRYPGE